MAAPFAISPFFTAMRVGTNGLNILKAQSKWFNSFTKVWPRTHLLRLNRCFHVLSRYSTNQCCKLPWSRSLQQNLCERVKVAGVSSHGAIFGNLSNSLFFGNLRKGMILRGITMVSKKGKRKTCKAVAKRFIRTGRGKLKRWRCGKHHNQSKKSSRRKRALRKPTYVSKTQLKTLNKMLNGW